MGEKQKLSDNEDIKKQSCGLRGSIAETLADDTLVKFSEEDEKLIKFHGSYQGYNRDTATPRKKAGLDKEWEMMVRAKIPGGRLSAKQYLALDALADKFSNGTLRVTSRQGIQFHNVMKGNLHSLIHEINEAMLTTFGGCGDVVRNVIACPSPLKSPVYEEIAQLAVAISKATLPATNSYHEIWVDGEKYKPAADDKTDPLYGDAWMPRKFKFAITPPEDNTVDALTNDVGLIALHENEQIHGYNIYIGGGFGIKHNKPETYPRLATPLGYVPKDDIIELCKAIVKFQRDHGDRANRQHARLKYVVEERGTEFCKEKIEEHFGKKIEPLHDAPPLQIRDYLGWHEQGGGKYAFGLPVTSGRIKDNIRAALRQVLSEFDTPLILMPTEDVILCDIKQSNKEEVETIFRKHKVELKEDHLPVELWAMSCVALPTCGQALTEGERARVPVIAMVRKVLEKHGLEQEKLSVRITGCANGCSRPYTGDIGIVGRAPGIYAIYLGGDFEGTHLSHKVADMVQVEKIGDFLEPFLAAFASERADDNESFGNYCNRLNQDRRAELASASGAAKKL